MSRAAKATLAASVVVSAFTVFGVHFMQNQEREVMYKGVERDEARQAAKKAQRQREAELEMNKQREAEFQKMQPTKNYQQQQQQQEQSSSSPSFFSWSRSGASTSQPRVAAHSVVEQAEDQAASLKSKATGFLHKAGIGGNEDTDYIASRWAFNGLEIAAIAATPLYIARGAMRGTFTLRRLARANWTIPLTGTAAGYASGYIYASQLSTADAASKALSYRHDPSATRRDDHYIIGGVVGGLLTPAIFLRSTGLVNGLLGGGLGFGGTAGLGYFAYQRWFNTANGTPTQGTTGRITDAVTNATQGTPLENAKQKVKDVTGK